MFDTPTSRRAALATLGLVTAAAASAQDKAPKPKNNLKQSICRWCYPRISLVDLCKIARRIGYQSIELLSPDEVKVVKDAGLTCAMLGRASIGDGLNRQANHARIIKELTAWIDFAADNALPNVICMSGNRDRLGDEAGLKTCAAGLKQIVGLAERKRVTICMEGLNSRVDHRDYMYDRTRWGVDLWKAVGSPRFKLLYDIYHMQIMEGDIIRTIRDHKDAIGHYHTGGNPGRHEIDETQELNYGAIARAIVATGYRGYLGQEFLPRRAADAERSLEQAFRTCDV
jgi:hydroxypyruvate isomerase